MRFPHQYPITKNLSLFFSDNQNPDFQSHEKNFTRTMREHLEISRNIKKRKKRKVKHAEKKKYNRTISPKAKCSRIGKLILFFLPLFKAGTLEVRRKKTA